MKDYPYNREPITEEGMLSSVYGLPFFEKTDLQSMIDEAYARGDKKIVIPRGAYRIWAKEDRRCHILLADMQDFVVEGEDGQVVFVCQDFRKAGVSLVRCDSVRLEGVSIDYEPCGIGQGQVLGFDPENKYVDIYVEPGYQCDFNNPAESPARFQCDYFPRDTHEFMKEMRSPGYVEKSSFEEIGDRTFRVHIPVTSDQRERVKVGDFFCYGSRPIMATGLTLNSCASCIIRNVAVWAGICGTAESGARRQTFYDNFRVVPGPRPYGAQNDRVCATIADGCHMSNNFEGARIENCVFDHAGDDAVNHYGFFFRVAEIIDGHTAVFALRTEDGLTAGERLHFYTEITEKIGEALVTACEKLEDYTCPTDLNKNVGCTTFSARSYHKMTLDRDLPLTVGGWVYSSNRNSNGFIFRNNIVRNLRPRGALIKASNGVVEGNHFYNIGTAGVQIRPEFDWLESGYSHNVVVRGNTFERCGGPATAAVMVSGQLAWDQTDIVIEDNTFIDNNGPEISLAECRNVVVRNNRFGGNRPNYDFPAVLIRTGDGIRFENNTFEGGITPVAMGNEAKNVTGIEPMFYTICSAALMTGKQGVDGWHFQYSPIGSEDYFDYDTYVYSTKLQDGWWQGEEENYALGNIRRWWFDTYMAPGEDADCVKTFICPFDGEILINAASYIVGAPSEDGIRISVRKNAEVLYEELKFDGLNTQFKPIRTAVKEGDQIHFRVNKNGNAVNDGLDWNPTVLYTKQ